MRKALFAAGFIAVSSLLTAPAYATVYDYFDLTFTQVGVPSNGCCGPFDVSAILTATPDGNTYNIVGISGTVTQNGTPYAIMGLISPPLDPGKLLGFDNEILTSGGGAPYGLDNGGIGFYSAGIFNFYPADPFAAFNIYGNGGSSGTLSTTASYDVNTAFNGTYSITATPLPSTWTMMLIGLAGLASFGYWRSRKTKLPVPRLVTV